MTHHFDRITQQIIQAVEAGAGGYEMPWHKLGADVGQPLNASTGKAYRGLNVLGLGLAAVANGYSTGRWSSYRQWRANGAQVRKGEKGTPIFFWQSRDNRSSEAEDASETRYRGYVARIYMVFNEAQVDGAAELDACSPNDAIACCDATDLLDRLDAKVMHGGDRAYFEPATDLIRLPAPEQFRSRDSYISVRAHETTHWTGAKSRLDRDLTGRFGTSAYAMEELVAELGAAFLCNALGVSQEPRKDHAAYISSWLSVMKGDNKAILTAASKAQQAVDYVLSKATDPNAATVSALATECRTTNRSISAS